MGLHGATSFEDGEYASYEDTENEVQRPLVDVEEEGEEVVAASGDEESVLDGDNGPCDEEEDGDQDYRMTGPHVCATSCVRGNIEEKFAVRLPYGAVCCQNVCRDFQLTAIEDPGGEF